MKLSRVTTIAVAVTAGVALLAGPAGPAQATVSYDGKDPIATKCAGDSKTVKQNDLGVFLGHSSGTIEIRYSAKCQTVWARIITVKKPASGGALINRFRLGHLTGSESCRKLVFSNQKLQAWTCYTPMLVAPHSSARASGHAVVGGHSFSARTGWYVTA